jgi:hypothetical protein
MVDNVSRHVEKAKALKKNYHCKMNSDCMLSVEHIELLSI